MVNITDAIKHAVGNQADLIRQIRAAALRVQAIEEFVRLTPDRKTMGPGRLTMEEYSAGYRMEKVSTEKVIEHISPAHPEWQRYRAAQRQASLLLTARLLLKLGGEMLPDISCVRRALKEGRLIHHASSRRAKSLSFAALRYLRKLDNRLQRAPERFEAVESWLEGRHHKVGEPVKEDVNVRESA